MPNTFALTPNNILLIASGMDPALRWDGFSDAAEPAGVAPPPTALTMGGSGSGNIVGTYFAYQRFIDQYGNFSNLSPISVAFPVVGPTGTITGATAAAPIVIASLAHNLTTGQIVKIQGVQGNTAANGTWTITRIDAGHFSLDGSDSIIPYASGGTWTTGLSQINYTNVAVPTETKVVRRQILRNSDGEAKTFYVDVDTTDLSSTSFSSVFTDSFLTAQIAVAVVDATGKSLVNLYTVPPNWKAFIAHSQERMFYAGEVAYSEGNVIATFGSVTATGIGTEWTLALVGRYLYVEGAPEAYLIDVVDVTNQILTLHTAYLGPTTNYSFYSIRPAPAERRLVYFSEAGLPEAVPAFNAFPLQEDGDEITGLMSMRSFLYVIERRHMWRITFQDDPLTDGAIYLAALRGCVSQRCYAVVDDVAYCLDEQGVHAFLGGGDTSETVSQQIQSLFRQDPESRFQINWSAQRFFHCSLYNVQEVIRWFVCLSGDYLPRHALCYAYRVKRWWIEEFYVPIGANCVGRLGPLGGTWRVGAEQIYLGSAARNVLAYWTPNLLDGPDLGGTVSGTVAAAGYVTLTDSSAVFSSAGIIGSPITITGGRGKAQTRIVIKISGTTLTLDRPWAIVPDATSTYQLGGVPWRYLGGSLYFGDNEEDERRTIEIGWRPTVTNMTMDIRRFLDMDLKAEDWGVDQTADQQLGIKTAKGDPDAVVDLAGLSGLVKKRVDGHSERDMLSTYKAQVELRGVTGLDQLVIHRLTYEGSVGVSA
jgi:hypothetical protein